MNSNIRLILMPKPIKVKDTCSFVSSSFTVIVISLYFISIDLWDKNILRRQHKFKVGGTSPTDHVCTIAQKLINLYYEILPDNMVMY